MPSRCKCVLLVLVLATSFLALGQHSRSQNAQPAGGNIATTTQPEAKVPSEVILVKGAWSSASDSITPLPEGANITNTTFMSPYFGINYPLPSDWIEKYKGPPPSDSGRYVLAQLSPGDTFKGPARGSILITAQDMFFTPLPAANALELINYSKENLPSDYKIETAPKEIKIAGHSFVSFAYWSPVAGLHWYDLATQIRCHTVEFILTSRDQELLDALVQEMNGMRLPAEAGPTAGMGGNDIPVCVKDYASGGNVISRVDPVFTEHRFNPVPVRIIIDRKGMVKHIHFLSAFPDQTKAVSDALGQWKFKPYVRDGRAVEVETGLIFGRKPSAATPAD